MKQEVILIFDMGKTNKKYYLFDQQYHELEKGYVQFPEITDDDGFPCDDLSAITQWMLSVADAVRANEKYELGAINFSGYGATLVHLHKGKVCAPMYNYCKPLPGNITQLFIDKHGDLNRWSKQTASPYLGILNAGLQLFWLKYTKPEIYRQIDRTLFFPQYLSYMFTGIPVTEYTGLGCHTGLWDFEQSDLHRWVYAEQMDQLLPELSASTDACLAGDSRIRVGSGIHDSSAALVPYLRKDGHPFLLLSTGTWSICLNPFNSSVLTDEELAADCLCYLQPDGKQVKSSRLFLGNIFTKWEGILATHFGKSASYHQSIAFDPQLFAKASRIKSPLFVSVKTAGSAYFEQNPVMDLSWFLSYEEAYHQLLHELVSLQVEKIRLVQGNGKPDRLYVDGGFSKNGVFLGTLRALLPGFSVIPSDAALGSSLGAAMVLEK
ncbi:MAG: carbohydrate kinase [Chitinophagaceae bacterium]|nr:carbohydrate kinase [Chitinophagaceae bacterium]